MDFPGDAMSDSRRLKCPIGINKHSRLVLARRAGRRCKAKDGVAVVQAFTSLYPSPTTIRSDNGQRPGAHRLGPPWSQLKRELPQSHNLPP
jgi:putative transposase